MIAQGFFKDHKLFGYGRRIWPNGSYTGEWKDGVYHGQGTYVHEKYGTYEGAWKAGIKHGPGKLTKSNGQVYQGNWVEGELDGILY